MIIVTLKIDEENDTDNYDFLDGLLQEIVEYSAVQYYPIATHVEYKLDDRTESKPEPAKPAKPARTTGQATTGSVQPTPHSTGNKNSHVRGAKATLLGLH